MHALALIIIIIIIIIIKPGSYTKEHSIDSLQQTAVHGTSHIIRKVLQFETSSLSGGRHRWFNRSTSKKRHATRIINPPPGTNQHPPKKNIRVTQFPKYRKN
jgi:hypothetical protein